MLNTIDPNMTVDSSDSVGSATQPVTLSSTNTHNEKPISEDEKEQYPVSKVTAEQSTSTTTAPSNGTKTAVIANASSSSNSNSIAQRLDACFQQEIEARRQSTKKEKRSGDLPVLQREYEKMKLRFVRILSAAKNYHQQSLLMNQYRLELVDELGGMSRGTPLQQKVISESEKTKCFSNVYKLASTQCAKDQTAYEQEIIGYCVEWERTIIARIDKEIVKSKELFTTKLHYEAKLPQLRKKVNDLETKNKKVPPALADKLQRNETKLKSAKIEYENLAYELVIQLEEAIICSWKDLFPLLQTIMKWESNRAYTENKIFKNLQSSLLNELTEQYNEVKDYKAVRMSKNGTTIEDEDSDYYEDENAVHMANANSDDGLNERSIDGDNIPTNTDTNDDNDRGSSAEEHKDSENSGIERKSEAASTSKPELSSYPSKRTIKPQRSYRFSNDKESDDPQINLAEVEEDEGEHLNTAQAEAQ